MQEFNRGIYNYIIATDATDPHPPSSRLSSKVAVDSSADGASPSTSQVADSLLQSVEIDSSNSSQPMLETQVSPAASTQVSATPLLQKRTARGDSEYGISRGIDFRDVDAVINFDFPKSSRSYTHRIGRTARGTKSGSAVSLITPRDESAFASVNEKQAALGHLIEPYKFSPAAIEGFRYRCTDALRAVTKSAIKNAKSRDIKKEILNSDKLKAHLEANPNDSKALRHDAINGVIKTQPHLLHIPAYLMPKVIGKNDLPRISTKSSVRAAPFHKTKTKGKRSASVPVPPTPLLSSHIDLEKKL